jgi:hypothetical protein
VLLRVVRVWFFFGVVTTRIGRWLVQVGDGLMRGHSFGARSPGTAQTNLLSYIILLSSSSRNSFSLYLFPLFVSSPLETCTRTRTHTHFRVETRTHTHTHTSPSSSPPPQKKGTEKRKKNYNKKTAGPRCSIAEFLWDFLPAGDVSVCLVFSSCSLKSRE